MSGVYYEMFKTDGKNQLAKHKSSCSNNCLLLGIIIVTVTLLAVVVAIGVGIGITDVANNEEIKTGLTTNTTITQGKIEGEYYGSNNEGGIRFLAIVNATHFTLTITTISGESVVFIIHPIELNMTMMGVNHTNFMIMEDQPGRPQYDDYIIPEAATNITTSVMMGETEMCDEILGQLDNTTVNETRQSVLYTLAMSNEAVLIIKAAQALGALGVEGSQYPAAMKFYHFALRLAKARDSTEEVGSLPKNTKAANGHKGKQRICNNVGAACQACPFGDDCSGLCGKGCSCWSFLCGDCCLHLYCLTHDDCCDIHGFFSWSCISVGWKVLGSHCNEIFRC